MLAMMALWGRSSSSDRADVNPNRQQDFCAAVIATYATVYVNELDGAFLQSLFDLCYRSRNMYIQLAG